MWERKKALMRRGNANSWMTATRWMSQRHRLSKIQAMVVRNRGRHVRSRHPIAPFVHHFRRTQLPSNCYFLVLTGGEIDGCGNELRWGRLYKPGRVLLLVVNLRINGISVQMIFPRHTGHGSKTSILLWSALWKISQGFNQRPSFLLI